MRKNGGIIHGANTPPFTPQTHPKHGANTGQTHPKHTPHQIGNFWKFWKIQEILG